MPVRMGKVRPKIGFHGSVTMAALRRKARQANINRRIVASLTRRHMAMHEQMRAAMMVETDPSMEDPRVKPPRVH